MISLLRRGAPALLCCLLVLAAADCSEASARARLVLTGSSTVAPLAQEIGRRFEKLHPGVRIDVQTGGSSRGIADARSGMADIGMASRALDDSEEDLTAYPIARDELAVIVHRDNPLASIDVDRLRDVYAGRIRRWSQLGGRDQSIVVVHKAAGRATQRVFLRYLGLDAPAVRADIVIGDNEQGIKTVAGNPNAIGYVSRGAAEHDVEGGTPIRVLALGTPGHRAERPLNLLTRGEPDELARQFLDYARSAAVRDLIRALRFSPLGS